MNGKPGDQAAVKLCLPGGIALLFIQLTAARSSNDFVEQGRDQMAVVE